MKEYIRYCIFICCLFAAWSVRAQELLQQASPKYEIRAVWLTTIGGIDWPHSYDATKQKEELKSILDRLKKAGINTVLLQTRVRGTTIYPSALEPWDGCMSGTPGKAPSFDPLQFAVEECHQRGMQLHAWVVTLPLGKWKNLGCTQLRKKHPRLVKKIGEDGYLNPEQPETADYLARCCSEIVDHYDVDGIHLDYIRYPETWKQRVQKSQGRANITRIVRSIHKEIKARKPWVMLSCAPVGKHDNLLRYGSNGWNARTAVCQDAQQWLREGIMDALFPMMYFRDNQFFPFAIDWQEHAYGRIVVPGLGIYFLDPREGHWTLDEVKRQLGVLRQLELGHCYFRSKFFTDNVKDIYDLEVYNNRAPALIPPMWWQSDKVPPMPADGNVDKEGRLNWTVPLAPESYYLFNVYASKQFPVDVSNPMNLVACRWLENSLMVEANGSVNYAITTVDRYGNESEPFQLKLVKTPSRPTPPRIPLADKSVVLPVKPSTLDADHVLIETIEGQPVASRPYDGSPIDVSSLPEGVYQWRTLGKKGRTHRLGFFTIKRKTSCPSSN